MSYITSIGTANPGKGIPQTKIADFMSKGLDLSDEESHELKVLYRATGIRNRYSVIPDYGLNGQPYTFFPKTPGLEPFPSISLRMNQFKNFAIDLAMEAIESCLEGKTPKEITHLITVSCTGMYAPGLDIELVEKLGLAPSVERTAINFMGCYAAFNALKIADKIIAFDPSSKILIVCVELCSLHFQKDKEGETLLANSLFSDGAAAMLVQSRPTAGSNLILERFFCDLEPTARDEMTWEIGDFGFEMFLSKKIPEVIAGSIRKLTSNLLKEMDTTADEIEYFAIHPGGKRILEVIEQELHIAPEKNRYSHQILREFGNMSSPTVLYVLKSILSSISDNDSDGRILSFAFGPGLTMESMLLKIHFS